MIDEEQVRSITRKVLDEEHLLGFVKIFEKEHNLFRGSHDKIGLPEAIEVHQTIVNHIVEKFEDEAIATDMIADGAILNKHLYDECVTANKIADEAITEAKLAALAVSEAKIATDAITTAKIAADAITTEKIANAAITASLIGDAYKILEVLDSLPEAGTPSRIVYLTTDNKIYRDNGTAWVELIMPAEVYKHLGGTDVSTVDTEAIADAAIETAKIANAAVEEAKLAVGSVTTAKVGDAAIEAVKIAAGAIEEAKLAASAVTAAKIAAFAVETGKIANLAIEEGKLAASAVTEGKIAALAVVAGKIAAGAVVAEKIGAGAVTTAKLDALAVTAAKIAAGTITAAEINVGSFIALPPDENLVGYWAFDEGSGALASDGATAEINELVQNGSFVHNIDPPPSWTAGYEAVLTTEAGGSVGNCLMITANGHASPFAHQVRSLTVGKTYKFVFSVKQGTISGFNGYVGATNNGVAGTATGSWVRHEHEFVWSGSDQRIYLQSTAGSGSGDTIYFDEVSLYEVDPGNDGTIYGAVYKGGVVGKCLDFDGENDYVKALDVDALDGNGKHKTITCWIYHREANNERVVGVFQEEGSNQPQYSLFIATGGVKTRIQFKNDAGDFFGDITSTITFTLNKWHHIAFTYDETHLVFYIDGVSESHDLTGEIRTDPSPALYIGARGDLGGDEHFNGLIDEARIYNRALTAEEINALYLYPAGNKAVRISGGQIAADTITATQIAALAITADEIAANAIVADKINASAVTTAKINALAINAGKIASGAITTAKLDALAVTTEKIAALAVEAGKIAANTITADQMAANSIGTDELIAGAVTADIIAANTILVGNIAAGAIYGDVIATNAITAVKILAGAIATEKLAADCVTAPKINVVGLDGESGRICVVDATDADEITGGINAHALTLIEAGKILISGETDLSDWSHGVDATLIDGGKIYTQSITAAQILAGAITTAKLDALAVTTEKIAADAITADKIAAGTITADEIFAGTITADKLVLNQRAYWYSKASSNPKNTNYDEKSTTSITYVKLKETRVNEQTGRMNIYFELKAIGGGTAWGRIYKNGVALGTPRQTNSTTYIPFNENVLPFVADDLIQIYVLLADGPTMAYVRNFRLRYDRAVSVVTGIELTDPLVTYSQTVFSVTNQDP